VLVNARGSERAAAGAGGDLAEFEMAEELGPFFVGGGPVFLAGPQGAAPGQECQVGLDRLVGVTALYPMVTFRSWWPAMIWAMCGGRPLMMASVMKIRRKS
jgi:hypothetical protein